MHHEFRTLQLRRSGIVVVRRLGVAAFATALTFSAVGSVAAHAELTGAAPSAGAALDTPPREVVLTFDEELTPDSSFSVTDSAGAVVGSGEQDLYVAERNVLRGAVAISEPGVYTVAWTATAVSDGDTTSGAYRFSVRPGSSPEPRASTAASRPDTAAAGDSALPGSVSAIGVALCIVAALLAFAAAAQRPLRR